MSVIYETGCLLVFGFFTRLPRITKLIVTFWRDLDGQNFYQVNQFLFSGLKNALDIISSNTGGVHTIRKLANLLLGISPQNWYVYVS